MAARKTPSRGGKPDKFMRDALIVALHREAKNAEGKPTKRLYLVADALVKRAEEGDVSAIREIYDRVEGKSESTANVNVTRNVRDLSTAEILAALASTGTIEAETGVDEPNRLH